MKAEELLSRRNMRFFNFGAIGLVTIAWLVRFYYFGKRETVIEVPVATTDSNGDIVTSTKLQKVYARDDFWLFLYTLFVIPVLVFIFVIQELQVTNERLAFICQHFYFLDYHIGKAFYLLMLASFILQHNDAAQWLFVLAIFVVVVANFVHPCIFGAEPVNGQALNVGQAGTDLSIKKDFEKAEADQAKRRVVKQKDPQNTVKTQGELEAEGKSIVEEKNENLNADKQSGKGTLKVRFEVTSPSSRKSFSEHQKMSSSQKAGAPSSQSILKSSPPKQMSQSFVDNVSSSGPRNLRSGRPRTQENNSQVNQAQNLQTTDASADIEQGLLSAKDRRGKDEGANPRNQQKRFRRSQGRQGVQFVDSNGNPRPQALRSGAPQTDLEAQPLSRVGSQLINDDVGGLDLADIERSILTPDQSAGQELLSPGAESGSFEEISRVAATLYIEMKKCIKQRNQQTFTEAVTIVEEMLRQSRIPCKREDFMAAIAEHTDSENRNLLHDAALAAVQDDTRFFLALLRLGFPLYAEDVNLDTPGFIICSASNESTFQTCFQALMARNMDVNRENDDDESFVQRLCLSAKLNTQSRVRAMLQYQPNITQDHLSQLIAKVAISKKRGSQSTKQAIDLIKSYVETQLR